ncbi:MAG: RluA family pseudouridine synthase [Salinibacterium sp.]|nr:RluA family pseudouridine synthase [Salinibacterium sp.]
MNEVEASAGKPDRPDRFLAESHDAGQRLDVWINGRTGWGSRAAIQEAIKLGSILVNGAPVKPSHRLRDGDRVEVHGTPPAPLDHLLAEDIPLAVIHEDSSMIVLDKAPHIPVHPGAGRRTGTLANALAFRFQQLSDVSGPMRPGIVHRLDRDTTGVICVARTNRAHYSLTTQFHERSVEKTYLAIAEGVLEFDEYLVEKAIGRHPNNPIKMTCREDGRASSTRFEVLERFDNFSFVRCRPKSGRTHQIRVHLASLGHPILCDHLYGRRGRISLGEIVPMTPEDPRDRTLLSRQALHAANLCLYHPLKGERMTFEAPLHQDMSDVLDALRESRRGPATGLGPQGRKSP